MLLALTYPPREWAEICRLESHRARDPVTKTFLNELAQEFEILAREEREKERSPSLSPDITIL